MVDATAEGSPFREGHVEADGFQIRYLEAGQGDPLVMLHGGGGLRHYLSHELLSRTRHVILLETPGFGHSSANDRTESMADLASTLAKAVANLGIGRFDLCGTSIGGKLALWLAVEHAASVRSLVLVSPAAIRPEVASASPPQPFALYAHPERIGSPPDLSPEVAEKQRSLTRRLLGPARDSELESRMTGFANPVLVVFGTLDAVLPSEMGRHYKALLPNCNLVFLYDAGHEADADRPEAFASLVDDFLQRQGGFVIKAGSDLINR